MDGFDDNLLGHVVACLGRRSLQPTAWVRKLVFVQAREVAFQSGVAMGALILDSSHSPEKGSSSTVPKLLAEGFHPEEALRQVGRTVLKPWI